MNIVNIEGSSRIKGAGVDKGKLGIVIQNAPRVDGSQQPPTLYIYEVGKSAGSLFQQLMDAESKGRFLGAEINGKFPFTKTVLN